MTLCRLWMYISTVLVFFLFSSCCCGCVRTLRDRDVLSLLPLHPYHLLVYTKRCRSDRWTGYSTLSPLDRCTSYSSASQADKESIDCNSLTRRKDKQGEKCSLCCCRFSVCIDRRSLLSYVFLSLLLCLSLLFVRMCWIGGRARIKLRSSRLFREFRVSL